MNSTISAVASNVGAGLSQVRIPRTVQQAGELTEQAPSAAEGVNGAALQLLQRALTPAESSSANPGHDLDVLA